MKALPVKMHVANVLSKGERYLGETVQKNAGGGGGVPQMSKGPLLVLTGDNVDKLLLHLDEVAARKRAREVEAMLKRGSSQGVCVCVRERESVCVCV